MKFGRRNSALPPRPRLTSATPSAWISLIAGGIELVCKPCASRLSYVIGTLPFFLPANFAPWHSAYIRILWAVRLSAHIAGDLSSSTGCRTWGSVLGFCLALIVVVSSGVPLKACACLDSAFQNGHSSIGGSRRRLTR